MRRFTISQDTESSRVSYMTSKLVKYVTNWVELRYLFGSEKAEKYRPNLSAGQRGRRRDNLDESMEKELRVSDRKTTTIAVAAWDDRISFGWVRCCSKDYLVLRQNDASMIMLRLHFHYFCPEFTFLISALPCSCMTFLCFN